MNQPNPWMPLLAALLASTFTMASIYLGHVLTMGRERAAKAAESRMKRSQRWEEFEEKTLLEFQDKAPLLMTSCRKLLTEILVAVTKKDLSNSGTMMARMVEVEDAHTLVFNLISRIRDDETRSDAMDFFAAAVSVRDAVEEAFDFYSQGGAPSPRGPQVNKITALIKAMQEEYLAAAARIGDRIRATIKAEAARREDSTGGERMRWAGLADWARRRRDALTRRLASGGSRSAPSSSASCPPKS